MWWLFLIFENLRGSNWLMIFRDGDYDIGNEGGYREQEYRLGV